MNEEAKKKILRKIPYGLYVVGVTADGMHHAFTGSWLSQCSLKPPCVMLGVRHHTRSLEMLQTSGAFSVNWLGKSDQKIFEQFFKSTPADGNRFGGLTFRLGKTQTPLLDKAIASIECQVRHLTDAGDHTVVIAEVVAAELHSDEPPFVMSDTPWHYGG